MERQFHTQFFKAEPKVCTAKLSKVTQINGETTDLFISRYKKMRNKCKIHLLETKYMKLAQRGLDIQLRNKFQGMEFRDCEALNPRVSLIARQPAEFLRISGDWIPHCCVPFIRIHIFKKNRAKPPFFGELYPTYNLNNNIIITHLRSQQK